MKKLIALLLACFMLVGMLAACGSANEGATDADSIADEMTSKDGKYQVAFITDVGQLKDEGFNQGSFDGVKLYANANGKSYKYYQPANGNTATDEDRVNAMKQACENGAEIVVAAGYMQAAALEVAAKAYPDVHFVFIDGWTLGLKNVAAIVFDEHQSGYLAGYATVMEGYTKLGFMGGGGGTNPACQRFGYGFAQGAEAAAAKKGVKVDLNYSWAYGAASAEDAKVVGVDVDQSSKSPTVITSATKGLVESVQWAIGKHYDGKWSEIGDVLTSLGAKDNGVGLPTATWSLKNWTVADYEALYKDIVDGKVTVSSELVLYPQNTANVTVNYVE